MLKSLVKKSLAVLGISAVISMNLFGYNGEPKNYEIQGIKNLSTYKDFSKNKNFRRLNGITKFYIISFLKNLNLRQQRNILWAWKVGKQYDLSYSLAAIAWKESLGGMVDINLFDKPYGSCGMFHNNLVTVINDMSKEDNFIINKFNLNKLCAKLQHNKTYSLVEAVKVLQYFRHKYKNNWLKVWAGYNGGNRHPNKSYAKDIYYRTQAIKYIIEEYYENDLNFI